MLRFAVPMSLQGPGAAGGAYLMNQWTFGLCSTMSDASGRPIMMSAPTEASPFMLGGVPVIIANQMPNVETGATPIAYGAWNRTYMVVHRRGVTLQVDPYSGGWCTLFKFDCRLGGGVVCPGAARLLRIR